MAESLRDWLPFLFQSIKPWVSSADIHAGVRWARDLSSVLEQAHIGIICVTKQNLNAPWILFEAGALSKSLAEGRVIPYLIGLHPNELRGPLSQFQAATSDHDGTERLVRAIAETSEANTRPESVLGRVFDKWWPDLEAELRKIEALEEDPDDEAAADDIGVPQVDQLVTQLQHLSERKLAVNPQHIAGFQDIIEAPNSGVVKLVIASEQVEKAGIRGGGCYYSFTRRTHDYSYGTDIKLTAGKFSTGFAGADYGYILRLGKIHFRKVLEHAGEDPPAGIDKSHREAWQYLWTYRPPHDIKEIRQHQRNARGLTIGGTPLAEEAVVIADHSYLLRSIKIDDCDVLVAFQVIAVEADGSAVLVWRIVKAFDTPISTGRED